MKKTELHREARVTVCNIDYIAGVLGLTNADVARIMGISTSSFYTRKTKPWTLQIGEIEKVADYAVRHGLTVSTAQLMVPFAPAAIKAWEEPA